MKVAKAGLISLSIAAAGSVFGQTAAGPDQNTLRLCDNQKYVCDDRGFVTKDDVLHRLTKRDFSREIFMVKSRPAPVPPVQTVYIVKEEKIEMVSRPMEVKTESYFEVQQMTPEKGNNWAYVPK